MIPPRLKFPSTCWVSVLAPRLQLSVGLRGRKSDWWQDATPDMVERVRRQLRGLIALIDKGERTIVTTDFADAIGDARDITIVDLGDSEALAQFRRKVRAYIDAHRDHLTLARLRQGGRFQVADTTSLRTMYITLDSTRAAPVPQLEQSTAVLNRM